MSTVQPLFQNTRVVDANGFPTPEFKTLMDQLLERTGGIRGGVFAPLADAPVVTWDLDKAPSASLVLTAAVGAARVVADPLNMVPGDYRTFRLTVVQDALGGKTLSWGTAFKFPGGTPPALATAPAAASEYWFATDGSHLRLCALALDLR